MTMTTKMDGKERQPTLFNGEAAQKRRSAPPRRPTQARAVLAYLLEHGSITADDAWGCLGIRSIYPPIHDLREAGHDIGTQRPVPGEKVCYVLKRANAPTPEIADKPAKDPKARTNGPAAAAPPAIPVTDLALRFGVAGPVIQINGVSYAFSAAQALDLVAAGSVIARHSDSGRK